MCSCMLDPVRIVECANHDRATVWSALGGGHDGCSASIAEVQPIPPIAFIDTMFVCGKAIPENFKIDVAFIVQGRLSDAR